MKKVEDILNNSIYKESLEKLLRYEEKRKFCKHDLKHFIDMSRIAYIMVLESGLSYSKELIYAIGLLHDIGRVKQYEEGIPHHIASVELSEEILKDIDFTKEEKEIILKSIEGHREKKDDDLGDIIHKSDKLSRECFNCKAINECYWSNEKKNLKINY
ncbi:Predicted HD superfamily hydrolase [uncultured Clostridium sp.]|uniref:HD domain-containing protein n=1 Tax=uncultured Clostridium sp. TaxID=59620 RepID=UPI0008231F69|nr:HD domain-containing protein [uncultured Clostridium sp.]SCJ73714.1 Predicted HD superfamily hydrolase [uncultured Clostridium sp.]